MNLSKLWIFAEKFTVQNTPVQNEKHRQLRSSNYVVKVREFRFFVVKKKLWIELEEIVFYTVGLFSTSRELF